MQQEMSQPSVDAGLRLLNWMERVCMRSTIALVIKSIHTCERSKLTV